MQPLSATSGVTGVTWTSSYDLRTTLPTSEASTTTVSLYHYASVTQATGEDWHDTYLTLDNPIYIPKRDASPHPLARSEDSEISPDPFLFPQRSKAAPIHRGRSDPEATTHSTLHVGIPAATAPAAASPLRRSLPDPGSPTSTSASFPPVPPLPIPLVRLLGARMNAMRPSLSAQPAMKEDNAVRIEGVTLTSGGASHDALVTKLELPAAFTPRELELCAPQTASLSVLVTNTTLHALPAGRMGMFVDGARVGAMDLAVSVVPTSRRVVWLNTDANSSHPRVKCSNARLGLSTVLFRFLRVVLLALPGGTRT